MRSTRDYLSSITVKPDRGWQNLLANQNASPGLTKPSGIVTFDDAGIARPSDTDVDDRVRSIASDCE